MKLLKKLIFGTMCIILFTCSEQEAITIFSSFPVEESLEYSVYDTYDIIDPVQIVVSNKYLFLAGMRSEPIFQQYELPDVKYIRSFGIRGRGPGEFIITPMMYISRNPEKFYFNSYGEQLSAYLILENGDLLPNQKYSTTKYMLYNQFHVINDSLLIFNLIPQIGIQKVNLLKDKSSTEIEFTKNKGYSEDSFHPDFGTLSVNNRYIVYAYKYRKQIDIYDIYNLKIKIRLLAKGHREKITTSNQSKGYYYDVYATDNFIYVYYINPDSDDVKNRYFIEIFDYSGSPIKRCNIGISLSGSIAVSPDDSAIYGFSAELGTIIKFDL